MKHNVTNHNLTGLLKYSLYLVLSSGLLMNLTACGGSGSTPGRGDSTGAGSLKASPKLVQSTLSRNTQPAASNAEVLAVAKGQNQFALQSLNALSGSNSNLIFSPYSLNYALAMTAAGANGETLQGMAKALSYPYAQDKMMPALNKLDLMLAAKTKGGDQPVFSAANALWAQQGFTLAPNYLDNLAMHYGAPVQTLDFMTQAEPARVAMNEWVAQQTKDRINDLFPPNSITSDTRLVLSNAVWFKGSWAEQFKPEQNTTQSFRLLNGTSVNTTFMQAVLNAPYLKTSQYQAVDLAYQGGQLSMLVIQPESGKWQAVLNDLDADKLAQLSQDLTKATSRIALSMPKFSYSADTKIKPVLQKFGMTQAFTPGQADLSGMTGAKGLVISDILHKAFIQVDETGSEAAAATGVVVGVTSIPQAPVVVKLDQAFIYLIRDRETGVILFAGVLQNPQAK